MCKKFCFLLLQDHEMSTLHDRTHQGPSQVNDVALTPYFFSLRKLRQPDSPGPIVVLSNLLLGIYYHSRLIGEPSDSPFLFFPYCYPIALDNLMVQSNFVESKVYQAFLLCNAVLVPIKLSSISL